MQAAPFIPYAGFVSDVKKTFSDDYLAAQHAMGVQVRHYKLWDKQDLMALHDSYFGKVIFHHLVRLVSEARREEEAQRQDPGAKIYAFAQHDLTELAPAGMNWQAYAGLIGEAVSGIRQLSFRTTRDLAKLFAEDGDQEVPAFDQQSALARMEEALQGDTTPEIYGQLA